MLSTMRSMAAASLALSAFSFLSVVTIASPAPAAATVVAGAMTSAGCFNSSTPLTSKGSWKYQSKGYCQQQCVGVDATVMAMTNGDECWCGTTLPAKSSLQSDDSECSTPCVGYPDDTCGGDGYWSVLFTSDETNIDYYEGGSSSSSAKSAAQSTTQAASTQTTATSASAASAASDKATVITSIAPGKTVIITQTPAAAAATTSAGAAEKSQKGGSTNTAGVAAGVVVAVVVIAALAGAAFFFWRRRQRQQADSGHQQLSDYSNSNSSRPMTFRPAPGPDARIDPDAMAQRRMSDGSIADNEDYSRRILKVTNA